MPSEWQAVCKDCGAAFTYSDFVYRQRLRRGLSAPERCVRHRDRHAVETRAMASSHFGLEPVEKPNLLGAPFLGSFDRSDRARPVREEIGADPSGMDLGLQDDHVAEIYRALEENKVLIVVAPTGAGKSTMIPYRLLAPPEESGLKRDHFTPQGRKIVVTQPRRDATREIPATIAGKLHGSSIGSGSEIGYRHSQDRDQTDPWNRLVFVTDGTLANWLTEQRAGEFSIIIVDEAHERSTTIDLILGLLHAELLRHPHLRLIILSATIHADSFVNFFETALPGQVWKRSFDECEKSHGYEVRWPEEAATAPDAMVEAVARKVVELLRTTEDGGILAFLPGKDDIADAIDAIRDRLSPQLRKDILVVPLHASLSPQERARATGPMPPAGKGKASLQRRVVIATNVAETSLTIPDIAFVVDSGLIKESVWDVASRTESLPMRWHSQAGCRQRWGRAGRNRPGLVYPLYSEAAFETFDAHTAPAAVRERLDEVFVRAKRAGVAAFDAFPWLDAPPAPELDRLQTMAVSRRYVDADGDLTERGSEVFDLYRRVSAFLGEGAKAATLGLDMAALLLLADRHGCLIEAATLLVLLDRVGERLYHSEAGLLISESGWPPEKVDKVQRIQSSLKAGCHDDLDFALKLAGLYEGVQAGDDLLGGEAWAEAVHLNIPAMSRALEERDRILTLFNRQAAEREMRPLHLPWFARLRLVASVAWPDLAVTLCGGGRWRSDAGEEGRISFHSSLADREIGGEGAVAAYSRREPDEDGNYSAPLIASVIVRVDSTKVHLNDIGRAAAVRALRADKDDAAARLLADAARPVGSRLEDGRSILRWTTDENGLPVAETTSALPPLDSAAVAGRSTLPVRFERMIPNPRTGEPAGFFGQADGHEVHVSAFDLGLAGGVSVPALLSENELPLDVVGEGPGGPRLSLLPRLEADWTQLAAAGEIAGTIAALPRDGRPFRILVAVADVPQARHLILCSAPRRGRHLEGLKEGDRLWLGFRTSVEKDWTRILRHAEKTGAAQTSTAQIDALARLGIVVADDTIRATHRLSAAELDTALETAPMLAASIRNLFARCHMLWGKPETLETAASIRNAQKLREEARSIWDMAWHAKTADVRAAVIRFQPMIRDAVISDLQAASLRAAMADVWEIAELRSPAERAIAKRDYAARRRAGSDRNIDYLRARVDASEGHLRGARTEDFAASVSARLSSFRQKLADALRARPAEEAAWRTALDVAKEFERKAAGGAARLQSLKSRQW